MPEGPEPFCTPSCHTAEITQLEMPALEQTRILSLASHPNSVTSVLLHQL